MMTRLRTTLLLLFAALVSVGASPTRAEPGPAATPQALCDVLLQVMKGGRAEGFAGRRQILDAPLRHDFDLAFMTRLVVGPPWRTLKPDERQSLVAAFSDYSIAVYASQFKGYSGERFEVDPAATPFANGDVVVHTKLVPAHGDPVQLDYLLRQTDGSWRIIDVFLNGTISEMAARRSEYSATLRSGGAAALVHLLQQKTTDLRD